jgi:hypothetical protein
MSELTPPAPAHHPIGLIVTDDLKRSRLTVFFRIFLVIPHLIWLGIWGIAAVVVVILSWFAALFTGRVPEGLHSFNASYLRYMTRITGYWYLLANPFPPFSTSQPYPFDARIDGPEKQSRVTVFFRIVLAIPALILVYVFRIVNSVIAILGWFYALATGQMNEGMRNISSWLVRYETQTYGYCMLLTGRYPSLEGTPSA